MSKFEAASVFPSADPTTRRTSIAHSKSFRVSSENCRHCHRRPRGRFKTCHPSTSLGMTVASPAIVLSVLRIRFTGKNALAFVRRQREHFLRAVSFSEQEAARNSRHLVGLFCHVERSRDISNYFRIS